MLHICGKLFHKTIAESQCSGCVAQENFPIAVAGGKVVLQVHGQENQA